MLYSDYSLGRFFAEAARQPWFENTIFLVTADHCASSAGRTEIPLQKYHIPALILAPGLIEPGVVDGIVSQIDLMPTLLSLLNMSYDSHFYGRSIFDPAYVNRAFIATYQDLGYLEGDTFTILSPVRRFEQYRVVPTEENPHHLEAMERKDAVQVDRSDRLLPDLLQMEQAVARRRGTKKRDPIGACSFLLLKRGISHPRNRRRRSSREASATRRAYWP